MRSPAAGSVTGIVVERKEVITALPRVEKQNLYDQA